MMHIIFLAIAGEGAWTSMLLKTALIISGFILDIAINALLLYLYVKALHESAIAKYCILDTARGNLNGTKLLDTRQHEMMVELTRYSVLLSMALIVNFVAIILAPIMYFCNKSDSEQEEIKYVNVCLFSYVPTKE